MKRILVAYATMAGSTAEVAQAVGEEIGKSGVEVEVRPLEEVKGLEGYDGVVVGAPMIMGWHRGAQRFLKKHRKTFQQVPLAVFILAMRLTKTEEMSAGRGAGEGGREAGQAAGEAGQPEFQRTLCQPAELPEADPAGGAAGQTGEHRGVRREDGVRAAEVVGGAVRDAGGAGAGG